MDTGTKLQLAQGARQLLPLRANQTVIPEEKGCSECGHDNQGSLSLATQIRTD
jgi:hypothetical protein